MKKLFLILFALSSTIALAQVKVETSIQSVTLFQQGAQVSRSGSVNLPAGNSTVVFPYLTQLMDPNSISLTGKGNLTILSISHKNDYLTDEDKSELIKSLEEKLDKLEMDIRKLKAKEDALKREKDMIIANQSIGGQNSGVSLQQLQQTAAFFRSKIEEINIATEQVRVDIQEIDEQKRKIQQQLQQERQAFAQKTGQVIVQVDANAATNATFELSYLVSSAYWSSKYDARVENLSSPVTLTQKAQIVQQTGEDWTNVELVLSTGRPSAGGQVPYMNTQYVDFHQQYTNYYFDGAANQKAALRNADSRAGVATEEMEEVGITNLNFEINENLTQQEFSINRKQTVMSSSQPSTVVLRELTLPAKYEYHAKPRLDNDAFLIAKVYDWEQYDLMNGEISLYNGPTYVGKSHLNADNPDDTLQLSLGRDQGIVLKRTRVKNKQEKNFFGNKRTDLYTWKIEVRNTKKTAVKLMLKDQVPVSRNEDIVVTINNNGGGRLDEKTGIIRWNFELAPGAKKEMEISYEIKYPKDKNVRLF